jgi:hypothetical protein
VREVEEAEVVWKMKNTLVFLQNVLGLKVKLGLQESDYLDLSLNKSNAVWGNLKVRHLIGVQFLQLSN